MKFHLLSPRHLVFQSIQGPLELNSCVKLAVGVPLPYTFG
ncbi:unnamed protein product [Pelagomonas calceolata]|uniref:Uncharacterized protein n=1 Tax=Pelagomonas calceolata TaxID=35677 RepID=A0A8J2SRX5_9STRA|nr:unnamed protein product [Pelagomonas calceolata]